MEQIWNAIQLFCAGVIALGGAGGIIVGLYKWAKKPDINRDEKIKGHDEMLDNDNKRLNKLEEAQAEMEETQRILMKSMLALMSHAIDGNNTDGLRSAKDELQEYLIRK